MTLTHVGPECRVGKHRACDALAWDYDTDNYTSCVCHCHANTESEAA